MKQLLVSFAISGLLFASTPADAGVHKLMQLAAEQHAPAVEADKAQLVFMRPSNYGGLVSATVYDVTDGDIQFIGALGPKDKFAHAVTPGHHRFMVVAENADFMEADVESGKTYYAVIRARPGFWKARFSLIPIKAQSTDQYNLNHPEFKGWLAAGEWSESSSRATAWYEENRESVSEKYIDYVAKWNAMLPADKAELTMSVEDGVTPAAP